MQKRLITAVVSTLAVLGFLSASGCGKLKVDKDGGLVLDPAGTPSPTPSNGSNSGGGSGAPAVIIGEAGVGEGNRDIVFECVFVSGEASGSEVFGGANEAVCTPGYTAPALNAYKPARTLEAVTTVLPPIGKPVFELYIGPGLLTYNGLHEFHYLLNQERFGFWLKSGYKNAFEKGDGDKCSGVELRFYASEAGDNGNRIMREVRMGWERTLNTDRKLIWTPLTHAKLPDFKDVKLAKNTKASAFVHCKW